MTDFYCDISAIGNEYQAYTDTPTTWAVPQDGNGLAGPGHSAAVAIATLDCASASASGAGVLGVLGVTVSSTLTGSGSTLATNIVTAINASATATGATYSALLLPLNKLVFARVNPGLTTQVQIMLRIAGVDWNGMVPVTSGTWGTAPTMGAFAGGADGPFGYLIFDGTLFGKAFNAYGILCATVASVANPVADTGVVHHRTRRSGVDLSVSIAKATGLTWTIAPRNHLFDDGTVWTSDPNGKLTLAILNTYGGGGSVNGSMPNASNLRCSFVSRSKGNFEIQLGATGSTGNNAIFCASYGAANGILFKNILLVDHPSSIGSATLLVLGGGNSTADIIDCSVVFKTRASLIINGNSYGQQIRLNGTEVLVTAASGSLTEFVSVGATNGNSYMEWIGGAILDGNGIYTCPSAVKTLGINGVATEVVIDGVAGVTQPSLGFTASAIGFGRFWWNQTEGPTKGFRQETSTYALDWRGDGTFPHCGAQNLQGFYWSHRLSWGGGITYYSAVTPIKLAHFYRAASATKVITVELLTPDATPIYTDELELAVSYMDSTDVWRNESAYGKRLNQLISGSMTVLTTSAKSWTLNGIAGYNPKKLTLTTAYPVKTNTEIAVRISICAARATAIALYFSPELL